MKVSLSWLNDYIDIRMDAADLADALTMAGLEVDSVSNRYAYLQTVLVGRIAEVSPHPNADKLTICRVETGGGSRTVVCGAPNVSEGMLAPVALPGTVLPDGTRLAKSVIRGEKSEGMLCSEKELGLGLDGSGIMALDPSLALGDDLAKALGLEDTVFELDLTPNRPDCLCVIGIAREIAAIQNTSLKYPDYSLSDTGDMISSLTSVKIKAPDHCPRYSARLVENIEIKPAPFWMQDRLLSVGLRPINNIVDITNYVLMETGQPLHAFDFDQLAQNRIVVDTASDGDTFVTLDGKERRLNSRMLMICDGEKQVAVGGVMGGLNSEIEDTTRRVLIEGAYFSPVSIRKTAKTLGLSTDASHRFERGVDPQGTVRAVNRAAKLMVEFGGGTLIEGIIDEYPQPQKVNTVSLSTAHTHRLLGIYPDGSEIKKLLESIEFKVEKMTSESGDQQLVVVPPSFRVDISRPEDLMEEVARLSGYNNIPTTFPAMPAEARPPNRNLELRSRLKDLMTGFGFIEAITYSFVAEASCDHLRLKAEDPRRNLIHILNPLSEDQAVMRTSLATGLIQTAVYNIAQQTKNLKLFEIGKLFIKTESQGLPREPQFLAALWTGSRHNASWHGREIPCDFYDIKGVAEGLIRALKVDNIRFTAMPDGDCDYTRPGFTAQILAGDIPAGLVGEIHPRVREAFDLKQSAYIFELDLDKIVALIPQTAKSMPIPKFPAIYRDITIIVDRSIETQTVLETVSNIREGLVENLNLFDVFEGDPIAAGKKSVSFRVTYRSSDKTLEDEDIHGLHKSITAKLLKAFDATLP
ncbi:MAG: phenylalanine--tRNA ligase subunit beta [Desulfobacteraceae bacterium]|jgi:phenylalanyl-tRNA synthetase beta chain|nr:phenylalanine--tRNA ligase subunit beta [Desulfobacteraceae bacterium]